MYYSVHIDNDMYKSSLHSTHTYGYIFENQACYDMVCYNW